MKRLQQTDVTAIATMLREARLQSRLTAREVARRAGVDVGSVTRIELGQIAQPTRDVLTAIGGVLGISAADLFTAADWLPTNELPTLRPYLRAKYRELPANAVDELERLLANYEGTAPQAGEDEAPEGQAQSKENN